MAVYKEAHPEHRVKNKSTIKEAASFYGEVAEKQVKELEEYSKMFSSDIKYFISRIRRILSYLIMKRSTRDLLRVDYDDCLSKLKSYISDYLTFIEQLKNMSSQISSATDALERFDAGQLTEQELLDELMKN